MLYRQFFVIAAMVGLFTACTHERLPPPVVSFADSPEPILIPADPGRGFQFPYLLRVPPAGGAIAPPFLLVEPNNSGHVSADFDEHVGAAIALAKQGFGSDLARRLAVPFLMPVFPRSTELYTHSLNRQTLLTTEPRLHRLDLQLLAMIEDARRRLAERGIKVHQKIFLTGFSASGMFATRFTALHPDAVQAVAAGGINGFVILPVERLGGAPLPFPLGVADLSSVANVVFSTREWRNVAQFIFMGSEDSNDAVQFDDSYPESERRIIYEHVGKRMLPDRWEKCQQLYREAGAATTFTTYAGVGHGTNGRMHAEVATFFRQSAIAARQ